MANRKLNRSKQEANDNVNDNVLNYEVANATSTKNNQPFTKRVNGWLSMSGWDDSNVRPHAPQTRTLTWLSYTPLVISNCKGKTFFLYMQDLDNLAPNRSFASTTAGLCSMETLFLILVCLPVTGLFLCFNLWRVCFHSKPPSASFRLDGLRSIPRRIRKFTSSME